MKTRLLAYTKGAPGTELENATPDEIIVHNARVSSDKSLEERLKGPDKLIRHCITNGHWSIFSMANLSFEVVTSRAMGRELLRHFSLSPQEFSQRYAEVQDLEFEPIELRLEDPKNRQSSSRVVNSNTSSIQKIIEEHQESSKKLNGILRKIGIAKECARFVMPENLQTTIILNGSVRSWITTLNVRLHASTAQKEIRLIAEEIRDKFIEILPVTSKALFNFEHSDKIHILDQVILDKWGYREDAIEKVK